ncbi:hypothetical protein F8M41_017667 [Gigaspora margarita]|uniref:Uncharacterized protein n=1 Tax=Gigaspora margarita TaxID=4874 RepID=A0A8H4AMQ2_GIGMA|nr:hypothetical protein F8M41_017667 [Gigaspora margarita]
MMIYRGKVHNRKEGIKEESKKYKGSEQGLALFYNMIYHKSSYILLVEASAWAAGVTTLYKRGRLNIYELKNAARNLNPDLLSRTTDKHYSDWIIFVQCRQTIPDK